MLRFYVYISVLTAMFAIPLNSNGAQMTEAEIQWVMGLNTSLANAISTGEGEMNVVMRTHKNPQNPNTQDSTLTMHLTYVSDRTHFLMDVQSATAGPIGKEEAITPYVISEDMKARREYKRGDTYAYVRDKTVIQNGNLAARCDPRLVLSPAGTTLQDLCSRALKAAPDGKMEVTQNGHLVTVLINDPAKQRSVEFVVDTSMSGVVTQERYYRDGTLVSETVRTFEPSVGDTLPTPTSVLIKTFYKNTGQVSSETEYTFKIFHYLTTVPESRFYFRGMEVPEGVEIVDRIVGDVSYIHGGVPFAEATIAAMITDATSEPTSKPAGVNDSSGVQATKIVGTSNDSTEAGATASSQQNSKPTGHIGTPVAFYIGGGIVLVVIFSAVVYIINIRRKEMFR